MDSPVHWECREANQHTTLCYGRSIEVCMRFLERMRRAQVAFTRPDAIDYSAHDLAHSIPSYLSRGCIGRKRFNKKFHNGLPWTVPCLTDCRLERSRYPEVIQIATWGSVPINGSIERAKSTTPKIPPGTHLTEMLALICQLPCARKRKKPALHGRKHFSAGLTVCHPDRPCFDSFRTQSAHWILFVS